MRNLQEQSHHSCYFGKKIISQVNTTYPVVLSGSHKLMEFVLITIFLKSKAKKLFIKIVRTF